MRVSTEVDMLRVDAYLDFGRLKLKVAAVDDVRGAEFCILAELLAAFLFKGLGLLRAHAVVFEYLRHVLRAYRQRLRVAALLWTLMRSISSVCTPCISERLHSLSSVPVMTSMKGLPAASLDRDLRLEHHASIKS